MTPSSIIFHDNFVFHDGSIGKKYLIILGSHEGQSVAVKTTSKGLRYLLDYGCQIAHRFPNFHLVAGCCCFPLPTWVCFGEFYLFMHSDLIAKHFKSEVFKYGELDVKIFDELIKCVLKSDDIPTFHAEIIIKSLSN